MHPSRTMQALIRVCTTHSHSAVNIRVNIIDGRFDRLIPPTAICKSSGGSECLGRETCVCVRGRGMTVLTK